MIRLIVNGEFIRLYHGGNIKKLLLERRRLDPEWVEVKVNNKFIPYERYESTYLKEGDYVELIRPLFSKKNN